MIFTRRPLPLLAVVLVATTIFTVSAQDPVEVDCDGNVDCTNDGGLYKDENGFTLTCDPNDTTLEWYCNTATCCNGASEPEPPPPPPPPPSPPPSPPPPGPSPPPPPPPPPSKPYVGLQRCDDAGVRCGAYKADPKDGKIMRCKDREGTSVPCTKPHCCAKAATSGSSSKGGKSLKSCAAAGIECSVYKADPKTGGVMRCKERAGSTVSCSKKTCCKKK